MSYTNESIDRERKRGIEREGGGYNIYSTMGR